MTRAEAAHKAALVALGCVACRRIHGPHVPGPVELHHYRSGGWGRGDYRTLIPLCVEHHRGKFGVHGLGTKAFDAHYSSDIYERPFTQAILLEDALRVCPSTAIANGDRK